MGEALPSQMDDLNNLVIWVANNKISDRVAKAVFGNGYYHLLLIDGQLIGFQNFAFTVGVCWGLDETGYTHRWCFNTLLDARSFMETYDGTPPIVGVDGCTAIK